MNTFDEIEKRIRSLLEASNSLFPWSDQNARLVHQLCDALHGFFSEQDLQGEINAPEFKIFMNPGVAADWQKKTGWEKLLTEAMTTSSAEFGVFFNAPPRLQIIMKNSLAENEIQVELVESTLVPGQTGAIPMAQLTNRKTEPKEESGALLLDQQGNSISLRKSVINLGRRSSNTIVINDLRVSRTHAQIRKIQEEYVIFDVGSTGGTFVNGERVGTRVLCPGDVISLAGYTFIFHLEKINDTGITMDKTSEIKPASRQEIEK